MCRILNLLQTGRNQTSCSIYDSLKAAEARGMCLIVRRLAVLEPWRSSAVRRSTSKDKSCNDFLNQRQIARSSRLTLGGDREDLETTAGQTAGFLHYRVPARKFSTATMARDSSLLA